MAKVLLFLISIGAAFQILNASLRKVAWLFEDAASLIKSPLSDALVLLASGLYFSFWQWIG